MVVFLFDHTWLNEKQPSVPPLLVRLSGSDESDIVQSFSKEFRIGRDKSCEVHIPDTIVSRFHASVSYLNNQWWIHDLDSRNGTFVDGQELELNKEVESKTVDEIRIMNSHRKVLQE